MAELAAAAGLADELALDLAGVADGLAIGHLRLADIGFDAELAAHAVDDDVQVQLAHPGNDGLRGLLVGLHPERRVFLGQLAQGDAHLLLVGLGLRFHRHRDHRIGEVHAFEDDRLVDGAQGVAGGHVLHADQRGDVAGAHLLDLVALVGVHLHHPPDPLLLAFHRVEHRVAGSQHPGIHAGEGQGADEGVGGDLERQRRERLVVVRMALVVLLFVVRVGAPDRRDFRRSREIVDHRVEHQRHALVLERGAEHRRYDLVGQGPLAQPGLDLLDAQFLAFQILVHQFVVGLGSGLDHVRPPLLGQRPQLRRDLLLAVAGALVGIVPVDGLHLHQVDLPAEVFLRADRQLDRHRDMAQALLDLRDHAEEIGALAIHFVDVGQARHMVLVGLAPDRLGLRLDPVGAAEHHHRAIEHAQRALHLDGEVDVAGGVDDVEAIAVRELLGRALPEGRGRRRGDGDAALLLLDHPVHGRRAVMDLAHLVVDAGVEEDPLGRRGLAGVDVGDDADVAIKLDGSGASHDLPLGCCPG